MKKHVILALALMMVAPASQAVPVTYQATGVVTGGVGSIYDDGIVPSMGEFRVTWTWDTDATGYQDDLTDERDGFQAITQFEFSLDGLGSFISPDQGPIDTFDAGSVEILNDHVPVYDYIRFSSQFGSEYLVVPGSDIYLSHVSLTFFDDTLNNISSTALPHSLDADDFSSMRFSVNFSDPGLYLPVYISGDLTEIAPVPVPAALWLMLSGLAGLGVVSRRKKAV